jgi:SMI1 / KNR4 family (SUKH-1)
MKGKPVNEGVNSTRRAFVMSMAAAIGAGVLGLQACGRSKDQVTGGANTVIARRLQPLAALDWQSFLKKWSDDVLHLIDSNHIDQYFEQYTEALKSGYLGFPGAGAEEIDAAEKRLGVHLPASYKAFLHVSNGWRQIAMDAQDGLLYPVSQIGWFRELEPESLLAWLSGSSSIDASDEQYFVYGPRQDSVHLRDSYLKDCLAISNQIDSAIYLLNPHVVDASGEWEAWFFGSKLPGANRYQSFQEMMQAEYLRVMGNLQMAIQFSRNRGTT